MAVNHDPSERQWCRRVRRRHRRVTDHTRDPGREQHELSNRLYVGNCYRATSTSSSCVATPTTGIQMIRVVVSVTWGSTSCASASCGYVTATLLSGTADPVFDLNQAGPPQPIIVNPGSQTSAIGDTVSLQLNTSQGVPTFTWTATGLPSGLVISTAGLITGSPTTTTGSPFTVTATTTDSFLDTATASFSWTILPKLTFTNPGPQVAVAGQAITKLTLAATGGAGRRTPGPLPGYPVG